MYRYILCAVIGALIWAINVKCIIQGIKERIISEIYIHTGMSKI